MLVPVAVASLPTSLTESRENLAAQATLAGPANEFRERLEMQASAEAAYLRAENDRRVHRSMTTRVRPQRGP